MYYIAANFKDPGHHTLFVFINRNPLLCLNLYSDPLPDTTTLTFLWVLPNVNDLLHFGLSSPIKVTADDITETLFKALLNPNPLDTSRVMHLQKTDDVAS